MQTQGDMSIVIFVFSPMFVYKIDKNSVNGHVTFTLDSSIKENKKNHHRTQHNAQPNKHQTNNKQTSNKHQTTQTNNQREQKKTS